MSFLIPTTHAQTNFNIENPLAADDLGDVIQGIVGSLLNIVIPIAVAMYLYAGFLWLTAGSKRDNITKAKNVFKYTTIGLVIIFIGGGFVDLIRSVLELGS